MKPNNAPLPGGFVLNNLSPLPRSIDTGSSHETLKRNKCKYVHTYYISYLSNYCSIESRLFFAQHNISPKNKIISLWKEHKYFELKLKILKDICTFNISWSQLLWRSKFCSHCESNFGQKQMTTKFCSIKSQRSLYGIFQCKFQTFLTRIRNIRLNSNKIVVGILLKLWP